MTEIKFAIIADTQIGKARTKSSTGIFGYGGQVKRLKKVVAILNKQALGFVVIVGDLVNENPDKDANLRKQQVESFKQAMSELKHTVYFLPGNHDLSKSKFSMGIDREQSLARYKSEFGVDYTRFSFQLGDTRFIGLNSEAWQLDQTQLQTNPQTSPVTPPHTEFEYLVDNLQKSNATHTILFCHHPLFYCKPDSERLERSEREDNNDFSILKLLNILRGGNVTHAFCGHTHENSEIEWCGISCVTTASTSMNRAKVLGRSVNWTCNFGFRLVSISSGSPTTIEHEFVEI